MTTLVLGLGHPDRGDDAAGLFVADRLRGTPGFVVRSVAGDVSDVLTDPAWEHADHVILIDTVRTGAAPGTLGWWECDELLAQLGASGSVTHELGVATTIRLAEALGRLPARLTLVGIEGASFEPGGAVSPEVRSAVQRAVTAIAGCRGQSRSPPSPHEVARRPPLRPDRSCSQAGDRISDHGTEDTGTTPSSGRHRTV